MLCLFLTRILIQTDAQHLSHPFLIPDPDWSVHRPGTYSNQHHNGQVSESHHPLIQFIVPTFLLPLLSFLSQVARETSRSCEAQQSWMITPPIRNFQVTIILISIAILNPLTLSYPSPDKPRPQSKSSSLFHQPSAPIIHWTLLGRKSELLDIQCKTTAQLNLQALKRTVPVQTGSASLVRIWCNAAANCLWAYHKGMEAGSSELDWIYDLV